MKKIISSFLYLLILFSSVFSVFFIESYQTKTVENGIVDKDKEKSEIVTKYNGDWEFYYNTLLVQDDVDLSFKKPDSYISISSSWANFSCDGERLPKNGYGSYRMMIDNLVEKDIVRFVKTPTNVSMNIYANRKLIASSGKVGRTYEENEISPHYGYIDEYALEKKEKVEIIIEVGYNSFGGLNFIPNFTIANYRDITIELYKYISFAILILLISLCVIEFVSMMKIYDSTIYTFYSIVCLLLLFLTTPLFNNVLSTYNFFILPFIRSSLNFIFYGLFLLSMYFFLRYTYKEKMKWKELIFHFLFIALCSGIYMALCARNLNWIPFLVLTGIYLLLFFLFTYFRKPKNEFNATFYHTKIIIYVMMTIELIIHFESFQSLRISSYRATIIGFVCILLTYLLIYVLFIVRTYHQAIHGFELKVANQNMEAVLLKNQIKPHFVFNVLNIIKALYHKDISQGDQALELFSKHLRYNVNTCKTNLIEFSKELENIYNLAELENLIKKDSFQIIYNIDYTDFLVPILSLEPFIENSIKYSGVNKKEDGYIEISSYLEEEDIIIEISDNGVGFDQTKVGKNSNGIKNAIERFRILLQAEVEINSRINVGTNVKIRIPRGEQDEDNHS